jgi:hypothetical protein
MIVGDELLADPQCVEGELPELGERHARPLAEVCGVRRQRPHKEYMRVPIGRGALVIQEEEKTRRLFKR